MGGVQCSALLSTEDPRRCTDLRLLVLLHCGQPSVAKTTSQDHTAVQCADSALLLPPNHSARSQGKEHPLYAVLVTFRKAR